MNPPGSGPHPLARRSFILQGAAGLAGMSIASTLVIGLVLAVVAANLYNRPRLIFGTS